MHSMVRTSLATVPRALLRLPCRKISNRRLPQPHRTFHQSPRVAESDGGTNKPGGAITDGGSQDGSRDLPAEKRVPQGDDCTALSVPLVKDLAHYGSAARRSRRSKSQHEITPSVRIPEWFVDNNVRSVEDVGRLPIEVVRWNSERSEYVSVKNDSPSSPEGSPSVEPGGDDQVQKPAENNGSPGEGPYFVDSRQWEELVCTTRGLLTLATDFVADDVASRKNNLVLHYAGEGGEYLLDGLVQKLSAELRADTVVLDALDIVDLACDPMNSNLSEDAADDRRLLSYDVYQSEDGTIPDSRGEEKQLAETDDQEAERDHMGNTKPTLSTIFLDLRGSLLDPSNSGLARGRGGTRRVAGPGPMIPDISSFLPGKLSSEAERIKTASERLLPLIEGILAGPSLKRTMRRHSSNDEASGETATEVAEQARAPLILEIRDWKMMLQTSFGGKFLNVLHAHVQNRRRSGQKVMVIGVDCSPKVDLYSSDYIREVQSEPATNNFRTMVITPAAPSKDARIVLRKDKKRRMRTINMRNLWQMLCIKVAGLYENNVLRQEWASIMEDFSGEGSYALDLLGADRQMWTFDTVHRLGTMMLGSMDLRFSESMKKCLDQACLNMTGSDNAKVAWTEQQKAHRTKSKPDMERTTENRRLDKIRKTLNKHERKLMGGVVEPHKIATTFDTIHAPFDTIDALKTLTTLSLVRPDAFKYGVLKSDKIPGLLLYGPSGTGKTLLAKAVAKESGATVLEVSGAELNDMYVGEAEKNVKALFSLAKKLTPCVVFIDEADAIFSARDGIQRRVNHRDLLNQFLREWDGMSNDFGSAFIMVATNRPFDMDDAVLRRLPRRILVDLPSESDRLEILKIHLREEVLAGDVNLPDLATNTPFYSGSDLKNLSVAAALNCVREENETAKNHAGEDAFEHAAKRTLTAAHFTRALEDISASISEDMNSLKQIKKFDEQYGDKRGKKKRSPKWGFSTAAEASKVLDTVKVRG